MSTRIDPACAISACTGSVVARGWCRRHYGAWHRHGDPLHALRATYPRGQQRQPCKESGCDRPARSLDLCNRHHQRWLKHGETTDPAQRLFWAKVDKAGGVPAHRPDLGACWLWTGYLGPKGYGQFGARVGTRLAHRRAYQYVVGKIGPGLVLDHLCRRRSCVRPEHLEPVTPQENIARGDQGQYWGYVPEPTKPCLPKARPTVCGEFDCVKPVYKRDICRPHYRRWLSDPNVERPRQRTAEQRFWIKVNRRGDDECWLWTASTYPNGYGQFARRRGDMTGAHRFAFELVHGPIPEGHDVHHVCHVRRCVNPAHLSAVTRAVNLVQRKVRR